MACTLLAAGRPVGQMTPGVSAVIRKASSRAAVQMLAAHRWIDDRERNVDAAVTTSGAARRLQFGCGAFPAEGWINTNLAPGPGVDISGDVREGLPIPSESIQYIASMHALVELPYLDVVPALRELHRVLEPGGVLRLGLPDLDRAIDAYRAGDRGYFHIPDDESASIDGKFIVQMTWYGTNRMLFTFEFAGELLGRAGFRDVRRAEYGRTTSRFPEIAALDNRPKESFFVEAVK